MEVNLDEIVPAIKILLILFGFIAGGIVVVGLFLCILMGMGLRNKYGIYDPLYKCWFDYNDLNEEQETRLIPGSDRLAEPPKGTKRQPPYWKEQPTLKRKILMFVLIGNMPRSRGTQTRIPEHFQSYLTFEKYLSGIKWITIENEEQLVATSGLYLFNCLGDNHTFYEVHELVKGEKLCKHYIDHHFDGWAIVKPMGYHYVEDENKVFVLKGLNML